jgi:hypothetical protein
VSGTSQFWQGLHAVKHWFKFGASCKIGNGRKVFFWLDVWLGKCPLKCMFPSIFECCDQKEATVFEVFQGGSLDLSFNRSFCPAQVEEWEALKEMVANVSIGVEPDLVNWDLEKSGKFSVRSLYNFITDPGVVDCKMMDMWQTNCPLKIKNFLRLCFRGKLQSASELVGRKWPGSPYCLSCGAVEDTNHILFNCTVARYCWCIIRDCFGVGSIPRTEDEFTDLFLKPAGAFSNKIVWFWFASFAWSLWLIRNDRIFNKKVLLKPISPLYKSLSLMQQWRPLVAAKRLRASEDIIAQISSALRGHSGGAVRAGVG